MVESVPRSLAQVGDHDRGADQDQDRRCLGMRRLQRDDQSDGRADLQASAEVGPYTLYNSPVFTGFLFRELLRCVFGNGKDLVLGFFSFENGSDTDCNSYLTFIGFNAVNIQMGVTHVC